MAGANEHITVPTCDAITRGLDNRINAVDARVTAMGADMDRRFTDMSAWVRDVSGDQKKFFWLLVSTLAATVGTLAMMLIQMMTAAGG